MSICHLSTPLKVTVVHGPDQTEALPFLRVFDFGMPNMYLAPHMGTRSILKPQRLKKGDLVGIVAPASPPADPSRIDRGVRYLEGLGYHVVIGEHAGCVHGYLAGTDEERLADLHGFFADRRVRAIIAVRGGYGTPRLLSKLNYSLIARNPKILVGFSDITALQLALWKKCSLVTFHGPMLGVEMADVMDPFTEEMFWRLLTSTSKLGLVNLPGESQPRSLCSGKSNGRLVGGNLSLVVSLLGTRYFPDMRDGILFLEETGEEPYRVDRMITQLHNAGALSTCRAILAGQFTDCIAEDPSKPSLTVDEIMSETALRSMKPFLSNLPFGHLPQKMTLPIGLCASIDASERRLSYLEAAVR